MAESLRDKSEEEEEKPKERGILTRAVFLLLHLIGVKEETGLRFEFKEEEEEEEK